MESDLDRGTVLAQGHLVGRSQIGFKKRSLKRPPPHCHGVQACLDLYLAAGGGCSGA